MPDDEREAYQAVLKGKGLALKGAPKRSSKPASSKASASPGSVGNAAKVVKSQDKAPTVAAVLKRNKTKAELAFEKAQQEKLKKELVKSQKSHKQRVADFNEKLSKLSEHYDIPKVGPG